ncbi:LysM peptidoglycan-binding domain-containing C40 family peptidase [Streptomyces sp. NPDC000410]|uniref:C40 family peptidase n=1 Tax=Streptomyces sp. NPDC000410 TaxID=3154254 RepID=UPI0033302DEB
MAQQTLPRPSRPKMQAQRQAPTPTGIPTGTQPRTPTSRRTPPTRHAAKSRTWGEDWRWPVAALVMAFVISLLAGVLLAVHGSSDSASGGRGAPLTLSPSAPAAPAKPTKPVAPAKPAKPPVKPAKPAAVKKVTLHRGDTLFALAGEHGTTVKALQRLNGLGTSTLIYAGDTFRVPAEPGPGSVRAPQAAPAKATPAKTTPKRTASPKSAPEAVIAYARAQLGKPYVWGGTGPRGYDCSGLVMRAWEAAGVKLPRTTWDQVRSGTPTTRAKLVPGDLVVTAGGGHIQLYIGNGKVIHAPRTGMDITVAPLTKPSGVVAYRHISV